MKHTIRLSHQELIEVLKKHFENNHVTPGSWTINFHIRKAYFDPRDGTGAPDSITVEATRDDKP